MVTIRGFSQTPNAPKGHVPGKLGWFPVGLVRGQYGKVARATFFKFLRDHGYEGYEEAGWELDLRRCDTEAGAEAYAKELLAAAAEYGLKIFTVAAHLPGQALGDEPSLKTLQFVGGEALVRYKAWRDSGNNPPAFDPLYVPPDVAQLIQDQALADLLGIIRLAHYLGKLQNREVVVPGFTGSPAHCWDSWFGFPPLPAEIAGYEIPDVPKLSMELLVQRFRPVFEACKKYGVRFGLECHPSERAMGDIASAREFLAAVKAAGFGGYVGINFDASHLVWQGVDPIAFIREFAEDIFSVHIKGVWVSNLPTTNGRLGGHQPMGHPENGWNFVTPGCDRDCVPEEEIFVELRRVGFRGAVQVEWEDNDVDKFEGAALAINNIIPFNRAPSTGRHDESLAVA